MNKRQKIKEKVGFCLVNNTGNNVFMRVLNDNSEILKQISAGHVGLVGPKKRTVYAAEVVGRTMGEYLRRNNQVKIIIYIKGIVSKYIKGAIKGLKDKGIQIVRIYFSLQTAHNGTRLSKSKRK